MTEPELHEKLKKLFYDLFPILSQGKIDLDKLIKDDLPEWTSLQHLNVLLALEDEFKIRIPDEVALNLISFPEIFSYLCEHAK